MPQRDVIVIGTSAGGLEALKTLVAELPANLPAALFITWHMPADHPSYLPQILGRVCALPVTAARDGEKIQTGHVYAACPDNHLVLELGESEGFGRVRVTHGPKENLFRPSVDVLFRSAARAYGARVIGVVLTGMLDDGASGMYAVKERGGKAVVQDPLDALYPNMPISVMKTVTVDHSVAIADMGSLLIGLVNEPVKEGGSLVPDKMDTEVKIALEDSGLERGVTELGEPSIYTCPECHGTLLQLKEGKLTRFRCHVGHAYSLNALLYGVTKSVEDSLWSALRAVEECDLLMSHMARHLDEAGQNEAAELALQKVQRAKVQAQLVRQAALGSEVTSEDTLSEASKPSERGV